MRTDEKLKQSMEQAGMPNCTSQRWNRICNRWLTLVLIPLIVAAINHEVGDWWLQRADVEDVAQKLGLDVVPIIGEGTLHDAIAAAKAGIASTWGDFQAEGIVARPKTELKTRNGHRIITKIKCRDFVGSNAKVSGAGTASAGLPG